MELEYNPILTQKVTIVDDPAVPLPVTVNHQESIPEHSVVLAVLPFQFRDACAVGEGYDGCGEIHQGIRLATRDRRLGDVLAMHENSSLYLSETNSSMTARWLMFNLPESCPSLFLQSSDSRKLVGFMVNIVAQNALRVKGRM